MGNKDDLILDPIRKELQKVNINYDELNEKKKSFNVNNFLKCNMKLICMQLNR